MNFEFSLKGKYFDLIKNKTKTIELRLYDDKRKLIKIDDKIIFTNEKTQEKLTCVVLKLYKAKNFLDLTKQIDIKKAGFNSLDDLNKALLEFYSFEKQQQFGVLGIEIEII